MRKQGTLLSAIVGLGLAVVASPAAGSPVTWEFAGEITSVVDDDNLLGGAVIVGTPFSGSFTFESTTPDSEPDQPLRGTYLDAITDVFGQIGDLGFVGPTGFNNFIQVVNGVSDSYKVQTLVDFFDQTLDFQLALSGAPNTFFPNDMLPLLPPNPDAFNIARFLIVDASETVPITLIGRVSLLLPEPATLGFLAIGAVVVARRQRRGRIQRELGGRRP